ncbi:MAG: DNA glycosylase [Candidatus Micrarchaeota archaeon]
MLINLELTMESGQPPHFLWNKEGNRYWRLINGKRCELWQSEGNFHFSNGFNEIFDILRSNDDLEEIYKCIGTDDFMRSAISSQRGLRLTLSDPWETLIVFLCSINSNIPRIRKNVQSLMKNGSVLEPRTIECMDLKPLKLGFRERFIKETASLMSSYDLDDLEKLNYEKARALLQEFPGVGPKVADCVLLFGCGKTEAFPVDVWMARAMNEHYRKSTPKEIQEFARKKWKNHAGYAQQYIFNFCRKKSNACIF